MLNVRRFSTFPGEEWQIVRMQAASLLSDIDR